MTPQELAKKAHADPFTPFRIQLKDGRTFTVHRPGMVLVGSRRITLGIADDPNDPLYDRCEIFRPDDVASLNLVIISGGTSHAP